jgi:hypothetical protein
MTNSLKIILLCDEMKEPLENNRFAPKSTNLNIGTVIDYPHVKCSTYPVHTPKYILNGLQCLEPPPALPDR